MRRWTLPSRAERGRVILSGAWTTSTCYKLQEIERNLVMIHTCSIRHQTGETDSFQLVIHPIVQLDNQGTCVPCEARIVWYSAGRTSSRQLRDTTKTCDKTRKRELVPWQCPHR